MSPAMRNPPGPSHRKQDPTPSSSPPAETGFETPYPEIETWIQGLQRLHPKRQLLHYIAEFEAQDYFGVDELARLPLERLTTAPFSLTPGNAEFLLGEAHKTVKRVDRERVKERKQGHGYLF